MRRAGIVLIVLWAFCVSGWAEDEKGLVAHWDFNEGKGDVLHDKSANDNDGKIHGAKWVKCGKGHALKFDGMDDYVDCGAGKSLDITGPITAEVWVFPDRVPPTGEPAIMGKTFGSYVLTFFKSGNLWWYISSGGNGCAAPLRPREWSHVVGTFDGKMVKLYINGRSARSRASDTPKIGRAGHFFMGKSEGDVQFTENALFKGMLDEARIYRGALSEDEVFGRYAATAGDKGKDTTFFERPRLHVYVWRLLGKVGVDVDFFAMRPLLRDARMELAVLDPAGRAVRKETIRDLPAAGRARTDFDMGDAKSGAYAVRAVFKDPQGRAIGKETVEMFTFPEKPRWLASGARILNNLVVEVLNLSGEGIRGVKECRFPNPRRGWIFIASKARCGGADKITITVDAERTEDAVIVHEKGKEPTQEAMRFLSQGEHRIRIRTQGASALEQLVVRAIPETAYCFFPVEPYVKPFGPYDWPFLEKHLLKNLNCMISQTYDKKWFQTTPYLKQWKKQGKRWIVRKGGFPGFRGQPTTTQEVYDYWARQGGLSDPLLDGLIVDEFGSAEAKGYPHWTAAVRNIRATERFKNKTFYAFGGRLHEGDLSTKFTQALVECDYRIAWEMYKNEPPSEAEAREYAASTFAQQMLDWKKAAPGCEGHMLVCFGHLLSAPPESIDHNANVDFKVWMDILFNQLANDPAFSRLYGVMQYHSGFGDEEYLRWIGRLYRHYCIEGRTESLATKYGFKYELDHIRNPDFDDGTTGWTLSPADTGGMSVKSLSRYGTLQGRYPPSKAGDNFLLTKRSDKASNTFSQEIRNLQPGRLYSVRMFTADYQDLVGNKSARKKHAVSMKVQNAELIPERSFQHVFKQHYKAHQLGKFSHKHPAWMNFHRKVFRAKAGTTTLTVSDWASANDSGGPVGQELMFNFFQVQPYLHE